MKKSGLAGGMGSESAMQNMLKTKAAAEILILGIVVFLICACGKVENSAPVFVTNASMTKEPIVEDQILITDASPDTSAMTLYEYDGLVVRRESIYEAEKEREIINYINNVEITTVENIDTDQLDGNMYGIEIARKDGTPLLAAWWDGYWFADNGSIYKADVDFQIIKKYFTLKDDQYKLTIFPNIYQLAIKDGEWNEKLLQESEELNPQGLKLEIIEINSDNITAKLTNITNAEYMYGENFSVQVELNGRWYELPSEEHISVNDIGYILLPEASSNMTYNIAPYGELPAGHYRLAVQGAFAEFEQL